MSNLIFICIGLIDRAKAEELLEPKPVGTFLVRITTKLWGYTISVKGIELHFTEKKARILFSCRVY